MPNETPAPPTVSPPDRRTATEDWLRVRGLPQMLPARTRARRLLARCAPLFVVLLVTDLVAVALRMLEPLVLRAERNEQATVSPEEFTLALWVVTSPLVALAMVWLCRLVVRRGPGPVGAVLGILTALAWAVGGPLTLPEAVVGMPAGALMTRLLTLAAVLALIYAGLGTFLAWALRRSRDELWTLGPMVVRVLPVLMIAVLFLFFNAEIWQVAAGISTPRAVAVASVLAALAVCVVAVTARDEMKAVITGRGEARPLDPATHAGLVTGTPLQGCAHAATGRPLTFGERVNLFFITIGAQLIQVALFGMLMFVFFLAFGKLSIADSVIHTWIQTDPAPYLLFEVRTPLSQELVRVATILATFCALSFAASSSSDATYRRAFLEPILSEARIDLAVRDVYHAHVLHQD